MSTERRVLALDGVRGFAVLLVVIGHLSVHAAPYSGSVGVTLFFVLSGYLITGNLIREIHRTDRIALRQFYLRRVLRLYPALIVVLMISPLIMLAFSDPRLATAAPRLAIAGLYFSDFAVISGFDMQNLGHTWSLAVEEQFYLVWPAVLLLLLPLIARHGKRALIVSVGAIAGLVFAWRLIAIFLFKPDRIYYAPDTNAFLLLFGCLLATLPAEWLGKVPGWVPVPLLLGVTALSVLTPPFDLVLKNWIVLAAGIAGVFVIAGAADGNRILSFKPLAWFGTISYGLYLWHGALLFTYWRGGEISGIWRLVLVAVSIGIAVLSFRFVERPFLRLKDRVSPRGTPATAEGPTSASTT